MLVNCCICQVATSKSTAVSKSKVGSPPILLKNLLVQCLGSVDQLLDDIWEPKLCTCCEAKLLEFYEANLAVARKRKEFKKRIKKRTPAPLSAETVVLPPTIKNEETMEVCKESLPEQTPPEHWHDKTKYDFLQTPNYRSWSEDDGDGCKIQVERKLFGKVTTAPEPEEDEPLANIKAKLLEKKANRYCDKCDVECPSEEVLKLHIKKFHMKTSVGITKKKTFSCIQCHLQFDTEDAQRLHMQQTHQRGSEFHCGACERTFNTHTLLVAHMALHEPNTCVICSTSFPNKRGLKQHMEAHDPEKKYQCAECGKKFPSKGCLGKHMMVHNDTRNFPCLTCGKRFRSSSHLKRHQSSHAAACAQKNTALSLCPRESPMTTPQKLHAPQHMYGEP